MKVIQREKLLNELESVMSGISTREIIEQSSCFIFQDGKVMTYNDEIACTQNTCLKINGAIQAIPFVSILRKMENTDTLEVSVTKEGLLLKNKRKKVLLRMDEEILLPIEAVEKPTKWKSLPDTFSDGVSIVQQCAGKDETRFGLTCIHLHPNYMEACDGYQAARYEMDIKVEKSTLVRKTSLTHIVSLDMIKVCETKLWIHFKSSTGLILSCRRWNEEFPDIAPLLQIEKATSIVLPKSVSEIVEKAKIFSTENPDDEDILVDLLPGKMRITGAGITGSYKEIGTIKYKGKPRKFKISPNLLADLVRRHNTCKINKEKLKVTTGKYSYITVLQNAKTK